MVNKIIKTMFGVNRSKDKEINRILDLYNEWKNLNLNNESPSEIEFKEELIFEGLKKINYRSFNDYMQKIDGNVFHLDECINYVLGKANPSFRDSPLLEKKMKTLKDPLLS